MPTQRVRFAATGLSFPVDFDLPFVDLSSTANAIATALQNLLVDHVFAPNKIAVRGATAMVGGRDEASEDVWFSEAIGLPAATTMNGQSAWVLAAANKEAFRLTRPDTHRSYTVFFSVEVTTAAIALSVLRFPAIKIDDADATKIYGPAIYDPGDDSGDFWAVRHQNQLYNSGVPATAGLHVGCLSFKYSDRSLRLYLDAATPIISLTVAAGQDVSATGRWGIGGYPNANTNWEGSVGWALILSQEMHGSAALDTARGTVLSTLASLYGVTLGA